MFYGWKNLWTNDFIITHYYKNMLFWLENSTKKDPVWIGIKKTIMSIWICPTWQGWSLLEILSFATKVFATTCNYLSHAITISCLDNYNSNINDVWLSLQHLVTSAIFIHPNTIFLLLLIYTHGFKYVPSCFNDRYSYNY